MIFEIITDMFREVSLKSIQMDVLCELPGRQEAWKHLMNAVSDIVVLLLIPVMWLKGCMSDRV